MTITVRGLSRQSYSAFQERCRAVLVDPNLVLKALIEHAEPVYVPETADVRIAHRLTFASESPGPVQ